MSVTATGSQGAAGSVSFTWTVQPAPDTGPTGLVRLHKGGKCLRDAGNRSANGTPADIWRCKGSAAQHALNAATGRLRWVYATEGPVESSPAAAHGFVYIGSDDHKIYALNAATGS